MIFVEFSWVQKRYCLWQGALFLGCKSPCHKHQGKPNKYHLTCDPLGDATGDGRPNPCDNSDGMYAKQVSILLSYFIMGCDRYHTRGGGVSVCTTEYQFVLRSISLYYGVTVCTTEYQFVLRSISLYYGVSVCTTECQFVLRSTSLYYGVSVCITESSSSSSSSSS